MLVYHMVLSFMDNNDWYSSFFSVVDNNGWYSNRFCLEELSVYHTLSWAILGDIFTVLSVDISTGFVCHGQNWLVFHPVLSVVDKIGW